MTDFDFLFSIAAIGIVQGIMAMMPLGLLAAYSLILELVLNSFDQTFSACWRFFFAVILLTLGEIIWQSWTASTPMADIILYGESGGELIVSISIFLCIVGILLLWLVLSGIRRIAIEAHGSGWGWGLLRLTPLVPFGLFLFRILVRGNALVGEAGFINLITR